MIYLKDSVNFFVIRCFKYLLSEMKMEKIILLPEINLLTQR